MVVAIGDVPVWVATGQEGVSSAPEAVLAQADGVSMVDDVVDAVLDEALEAVPVDLAFLDRIQPDAVVLEGALPSAAS